MRVESPTGEKYKITRRWLPWRRRARMPGGGWDIPLGDDPISAAIAAILLVPFLILVLVVSLELALLLLLLPIYLVWRVMFGGPWPIEVLEREGWLRWTLLNTEMVAGYGASGARMQQIAAAIRAGGVRGRASAEPPGPSLPGDHRLPFLSDLRLLHEQRMAGHSRTTKPARSYIARPAPVANSSARSAPDSSRTQRMISANAAPA